MYLFEDERRCCWTVTKGELTGGQQDASLRYKRLIGCEEPFPFVSSTLRCFWLAVAKQTAI
jgi:hypothetical protein